MTVEPVVRVENLRVRFAGSDVPAVDGISFTIAAGECLALVGESGSGKSVTARSLVGLVGSGSSVLADRLEVRGRDVTGLNRRALERLRGPLSAPSAKTPSSRSILFGWSDAKWTMPFASTPPHTGATSCACDRAARRSGHPGSRDARLLRDRASSAEVYASEHSSRQRSRLTPP